MQKVKCRYFFIDKQIYYQGKKLPDRKVELFNVSFDSVNVTGYDKDGDEYTIPINDLIIEFAKEDFENINKKEMLEF